MNYQALIDGMFSFKKMIEAKTREEAELKAKQKLSEKIDEELNLLPLEVSVEVHNK